MHEMPFSKEQEFEKKVLRAYIGRTRSKQFLSITGSGNSLFMDYFEQQVSIKNKPVHDDRTEKLD